MFPYKYFVLSQPAFSFLNILFLNPSGDLLLNPILVSADVSIAVIMAMSVSMIQDTEAKVTVYRFHLQWKLWPKY